MMPETQEQPFVADRDVFDLLMSSKQRLTHAVMMELVRDRRIFVSAKSTREQLADYISMLPHDYNDLATLIDKSIPSSRLEKSTFLELPPDITIDDVKDAIREYTEAAPKGDKVAIPSSGKTKLAATFEYDELDYSRNALAQRQRRSAQIEVMVEDNATVVRLPASEKAKAIVDDLRKRIAAKREMELTPKHLSLEVLTLPEDRTNFFTSLITSIPKHDLQSATNVRVSIFEQSSPDDEMDDDVGEMRAEMLAIVNKVALGGDNIIATEQFRQLSKDGFFIVGITWRSIQKEEPGDLIKFSVSFDDPVAGTGIRYVVRHAPKLGPDRFANSFKRLSEIRESALLRLVESAAVKVLDQVVAAREAVEPKK